MSIDWHDSLLEYLPPSATFSEVALTGGSEKVREGYTAGAGILGGVWDLVATPAAPLVYTEVALTGGSEKVYAQQALPGPTFVGSLILHGLNAGTVGIIGG
jgi:hypothetical protein